MGHNSGKGIKLILHVTIQILSNLQCISIDMLADKLNMSSEDAERWIVNLIRNAHLDAKIDSKLGHVMMGTQAVSPYEQVRGAFLSLHCHTVYAIIVIGMKLWADPELTSLPI